MDQLTALKKAVEAAGGQAPLAEKIGCSQQRVSWWVTKSGRAAPEFVLAIEAATGVSRHDLRPDIYPRKRDPAPSNEKVA